MTENKTIENMERLFKAARENGFEVFISPHCFYPTDKGWNANGPLEADEFRTGTFARSGVLKLDGFENSVRTGLPASSRISKTNGRSSSPITRFLAPKPMISCST